MINQPPRLPESGLKYNNPWCGGVVVWVNIIDNNTTLGDFVLGWPRLWQMMMEEMKQKQVHLIQIIKIFIQKKESEHTHMPQPPKNRVFIKDIARHQHADHL